MNKWLYKTNKIIYMKLSYIRQSYYLFIDNKQKAEKIITEHMNW